MSAQSAYEHLVSTRVAAGLTESFTRQEISDIRSVLLKNELRREELQRSEKMDRERAATVHEFPVSDGHGHTKAS